MGHDFSVRAQNCICAQLTESDNLKQVNVYDGCNCRSFYMSYNFGGISGCAYIGDLYGKTVKHAHQMITDRIVEILEKYPNAMNRAREIIAANPSKWVWGNDLNGKVMCDYDFECVYLKQIVSIGTAMRLFSEENPDLLVESDD